MNKLIPVILFCSFAFMQGISGQKNSDFEKFLQKADEFKKNTMRDSAIFYYKKAAAGFKENKKTEKLIYAYNQIGVLLTRQDKYEEGRMYLGMAEIQGNTLRDTNDLLRASTFIGLGVIYSSVGDFNGSLAYHYRALAIRLLKSGKYDADVATSYGNIGNVYFIKKDLDHALEAHLTALDIRKKVFGEKSEEINQTYNNLGKVYREMGDYTTSLEYYNKLLQNKMDQVGPQHTDLVKVYNALSEVYYLMGNATEGDLNKMKGDEILKM